MMNNKRKVNTILYKAEDGQIYLELQCAYYNPKMAQQRADEMNKNEHTNKYFIGEQEAF